MVFLLDSVSQIVINELFVHPSKVKYSVSKLLFLLVLSLLVCMYWYWSGREFIVFLERDCH